MLYEGALAPKVLFISDYQRVHCKAEGKVFSEWLGQPLMNAIKRAGILSSEYGFCCRRYDQDDHAWRSALKTFIGAHRPNVLVPLGEKMLEAITGLEGIQKWHCSVVKAKAALWSTKCIPMLHPEYIQKVWSDHVYLTLACNKLKSELLTPDYNVPERKFLIDLPVAQAVEYLNDRVASADVVAIDWEFGRGQLNTLGFAVSSTEAIAIRCLPSEFGPEDFFKIFECVRRISSGPGKKICQNAIVEATWLARYGIAINNVHHDTMWCMKFLNPELEKGLDNVGRFYTPFPYWKDDNEDWANIRDWRKHLEYNCRDTTGTFAAFESQVNDLRKRGLNDHFYNVVMGVFPALLEMCVSGLRVDESALEGVRQALLREQDSFNRIISSESSQALGESINVRSPAQVKAFLKALKMKLPLSGGKETVDKKALVKLKRKYPKSTVLPALIGLSSSNKSLATFTDFSYDRETNKVHYQLDACSNEMGEWGGYGASWGEGFNPQKVPRAVRSAFVADEGCELIEISLSLPETRYVAFDAPEITLLKLLETGEDIARYVAGKLFGKVPELVSIKERRVANKVAWASQRGIGVRTFAEMCSAELNHYVEEKESRRLLESYLEIFPGIRNRQERIKRDVYNRRVIKTPLGRERHFYARPDQSFFREAFAYAPQSTTADLTKYLLLGLRDNRDLIGFSWDHGGRFLLQMHDSILLQASSEFVHNISDYARSLDWHPEILLTGGQLRVPVVIKSGPNWRAVRLA